MTIKEEIMNVLSESTKGANHANTYSYHMEKHHAAVEKGDFDAAEGHAQDAEAAAEAHYKATGKKIKDPSYTGDSPHISESIVVDMSEHLEALTEGENLSEEFKSKAATIFETAVVSRVKSEIYKLEEEFNSRLDERVEEFKEGLVEKVDGYLGYIAEQWITQNEIALEAGVKSEILESFVEGLKGVFEQHYIEVPEERYDVLGDMQEQIESLKSNLDEQYERNVSLSKELNEQKRMDAVYEFSDTMTDIEFEKFKDLAEELVYEDAGSYKKKLQVIRENYFTKKSNTLLESIVSDSPVELTEDTNRVDPAMKRYLSVFDSIKK